MREKNGTWVPALSAALLAVLLAACLFSFAAAAGSPITSKEQLNNPSIRLGVSTGTASSLIAEKELPLATLVWLDDTSAAYEAVAQGKLDAYCFDRRQMELAIASGRQGVRLLEEDQDLAEMLAVGVGISPVSSIPNLGERINAFIREIKSSGIFDEMYDRWVYQRNWKIPEIPPAKNPSFRLTVGTSGVVTPYSFYQGITLTGLDIELARRFAAWLGADLSLKVYDYGAIIAAAASGDVDCIMANLNITAERAETIAFSDPLYQDSVAIMVRTKSNSVGFWQAVSSGFEKTFLREDRWRLFLTGVQNTLLITVLSVLFGTALGFGVYLLCRRGGRLANGLVRVSLWLVQGMPTVVLLMILYYIVFSGTSVSGLLIAVVAFTLIFGAAVFGLLKMGVGAVSRGQAEAAWALGYSDRRTFRRIILPQALPHVMPSFRGEVISLMKATAVVGYIAVQDLTRMADIVRNRTYDAFFPLIAITVIYFMLEELVGLLIGRLCLAAGAKRHHSCERFLKGVNRSDTGSGAGSASPGPAPAGDSRPLIRIEHLRKEYPNVTPLQDVSAEIRSGDVVSVIGPSGTGKSTLLRCINLLETPTSGRVFVGETEITAPRCNVPKVRRKMGMVFQSFNLFGHMTVLENIMRPPVELLGVPKQKAYDEAMRLLHLVGLPEKALSWPEELSGGQQQRVAIARALSMNPDIILLDEPTSALDPSKVGEVESVIRDLAHSGKTMMIVTHDMAFARSVCTRVFYMDEGGIYEEGSPEEVFGHPRRENTRRFIRNLKVLPLEIETGHYDYLSTAGEIDQWSTRNRIPPIIASRIRLAFEELVAQMILGRPEVRRVRISLGYSEKEAHAEMAVSYDGPLQDWTACGDALSLAVLRCAVSEITYEPASEAADRPASEKAGPEPLPNQLFLKIRES